MPQALKDIFLGSIMVDRYGCPEDIAHAAVYFGSDEAAYCTGQIINIDGGMSSHAPTVAQFRELSSRTWQVRGARSPHCVRRRAYAPRPAALMSALLLSCSSRPNKLAIFIAIPFSATPLQGKMVAQNPR